MGSVTCGVCSHINVRPIVVKEQLLLPIMGQPQLHVRLIDNNISNTFLIH